VNAGPANQGHSAIIDLDGDDARVELL